MPTSLPARQIEKSDPISSLAVLAVVLAFFVLIVLTLRAPPFNETDAAARFPSEFNM